MVVTILYNASINKGNVHQLNPTFTRSTFANEQLKPTKMYTTKTYTNLHSWKSK